MSCYRIQSADRDVNDLLDPEMQWSTSYSTDTDRHGVSVCAGPEQLAAYLAQVGIPFDATYVMVQIDGDHSDEDDEDAELGALLILPDRIISVEPVTDRLLDLIDAACDAAA